MLRTAQWDSFLLGRNSHTLSRFLVSAAFSQIAEFLALIYRANGSNIFLAHR